MTLALNICIISIAHGSILFSGCSWLTPWVSPEQLYTPVLVPLFAPKPHFPFPFLDTLLKPNLQPSKNPDGTSRNLADFYRANRRRDVRIKFFWHQSLFELCLKVYKQQCILGGRGGGLQMKNVPVWTFNGVEMLSYTFTFK